jgi:hypothetical protein
LPESSITQTVVRLPPISNPANILIAAFHSLLTNHHGRVSPTPESSNLMYGMYKGGIYHRLGYRGYDSAGVAALERGCLERRRAEDKLKELGGETCCGTARRRDRHRPHTGRATHGRPTETNTSGTFRRGSGSSTAALLKLQDATARTRRQGLLVRDRDRFRDRGVRRGRRT